MAKQVSPGEALDAWMAGKRVAYRIKWWSSAGWFVLDPRHKNDQEVSWGIESEYLILEDGEDAP